MVRSCDRKRVNANLMMEIPSRLTSRDRDLLHLLYRHRAFASIPSPFTADFWKPPSRRYLLWMRRGSGPLGIEELRRIARNMGSVRRFLTYEEVLAALENLQKRFPKYVHVKKVRLSSGQFLFHARIGDLHSPNRAGAVIDAHADEFPGLTTAYEEAQYVLQDVLNGGDRCLHLFGTSPDQALLQVPAIRLANEMIASGRLDSNQIEKFLKLLRRHPDPRQNTEWSGADEHGPATTIGRLFLDREVAEMARLGLMLLAWIPLHCTLGDRTHGLVGGRLLQARRVAVNMELATNAYGVLRTPAGKMPTAILRGTASDIEENGIRPIDGCRAVYPQAPLTRNGLALVRDDLDVGTTTYETVPDLHPGVVTLTPEMAQLTMHPLRGEIDSWPRDAIDRRSASKASFLWSFVPALVDIAGRLPAEDPLVSMTRALLTGPARWGTPKDGSAPPLGTIGDIEELVDLAYGSTVFLARNLATARAMLDRYQSELSKSEQQISTEFQQRHDYLAEYATWGTYQFEPAMNVIGIQLTMMETFWQFASGRELARDVIELLQEAGIGPTSQAVELG